MFEKDKLKEEIEKLKQMNKIQKRLISCYSKRKDEYERLLVDKSLNIFDLKQKIKNLEENLENEEEGEI